MAFDIAEALGADEGPAAARFTLYFPNKDRHGQNIDPKPYIDAAMEIMADINVGVTQEPTGSGIWKRGPDDLVEEDTTLVYSYLRAPQEFVDRFAEIRSLLYDFAESTNQKEVFVDYFGEDEDGNVYARSYSITFPG